MNEPEGPFRFKRNPDGSLDLTKIKVWDPDEFEEMLEREILRLGKALPHKHPPRSSAAAHALQGSGFVAIDVEHPNFPPDLRAWIVDGVPAGERSDVFHSTVKGLKEFGWGLGWRLESIEDVLRRHPGGIAAKFLKPRDRLHREVERSYDKVQIDEAKYGEPPSASSTIAPGAAAGASGAPPGPAGPTGPQGPTAPSVGVVGASGAGTSTAMSVPLLDPWRKWVVPSFPFEVLPPKVRDFVLLRSRAMGADPNAMAVATLTAMSGAIHHRSFIRMQDNNEDWEEHVRLWGLLVGPPAFLKTPIVGAAMRPVEGHQAKLLIAYMLALHQFQASQGASPNPSAQPPSPPERFVIGDATVEKIMDLLTYSDRGALARFDELTSWLGSMGKYSTGAKGGVSDRAFWLQTWNGGLYLVDRVSGGSKVVNNLSLSILAGVQPDRLAEFKGLTSDGLMLRFLPVMMREPVEPEDIDTEDANDGYDAVIRALIALPPKSLFLTTDSVEAMRALCSELRFVEREGATFGADFSGFAGKLRAYAGVLTAIFHILCRRR